MPLSEQERKALHQLERELFIEEPDLARQLESGIPSPGPAQPRMRDVVSIALGVLLLLLSIPLQAFLLAIAGSLLVLQGSLAHRSNKTSFGSRHPW